MIKKDFYYTLEILVLVFTPHLITSQRLTEYSNNKKQKEFKVGIIDNSPHSSYLMNYFGNNIFLDETELPKEDVLFIVPWVRDELDLKAHRPYNCAGISDSREIISSALFWHKFIRRFIPACLNQHFYHFGKNL